METQKQNGVQKDFNDSDQEEVAGRTKVLVHQDALDIPEHTSRKDLSSGDRPQHLNDTKGSKRRPSQIVELDDVITPLSEESSPTTTGKQWDVKPSVEQEDTDDEDACFNKLFPCCGDLFDPGSITWGGLFGLLVSFVMYVGNIASDLYVCYLLFFLPEKKWFILVTVFTVVPTVILNAISYHLSVSKMLVKRSLWNESESIVVSVFVALLHISQFGVIARYFGYVLLHELEYLWLIFCPNVKRKDYDRRSGRYIELPYLPYLLMVEAMLQCLPQLMVQLTVLLKVEDLSHSMCQALIMSLIVTLLNLTRLLTTCKHVQKNFSIPWTGLCLIYMWFLFTNIARVISFTLFMSKFLFGFLMLCIFHWIIMSIWAMSVLTPSVPCCTVAGFYRNLVKYFKGFIFGIIYLLCFVELKIADDTEESGMPLRYLYTFFYAVIFLENTVVIVLWYVYCSGVWYSIPVLIVTFVSFFVGVFFMCLYYRYFHKNVIDHANRWKAVGLFPARTRDV